MRHRIIVLIFICICFAQSSYSQQDQNLRAEFEKLTQDYERLLKDRDNILAQSKNLLQYKVKIRELEDETKIIEGKNKQLEQEKLLLGAQISDLKERLEGLQMEKGQLQSQLSERENLIEKMEVEYKIVNDTKLRLKAAEKEAAQAQDRIRSLEDKVGKVESEKIAVKAEEKLYQRQYNELRKKYTEAVAVNKQLDKKLSELPQKFAEIARENKLLLKETALMHYNLGVFYTGEGQHRRAIAEFEKALELNPDDVYAYFNLGYIYAEYLVDRKKAVDYFRKYLRLAGVDDKDVDWVKKYILTWQAWEGGTPIK
jgi:tetratricopeptide (TPR) repeat protein